MSGALTLVYNRCGRFHSGECWNARPGACFNCDQYVNFIKDYLEKRSGEGSQMIVQSSAGENISTASRGRG